jgi:hypothetical protein
MYQRLRFVSRVFRPSLLQLTVLIQCRLIQSLLAPNMLPEHVTHEADRRPPKDQRNEYFQGIKQARSDFGWHHRYTVVLVLQSVDSEGLSPLYIHFRREVLACRSEASERSADG